MTTNAKDGVGATNGCVAKGGRWQRLVLEMAHSHLRHPPSDNTPVCKLHDVLLEMEA